MYQEVGKNAFTLAYDSICLRLMSAAVVCGPDDHIAVKAKWDTGATTTCISAETVKALNLTPIGSTTINTSNHSSDAKVYLVDIVLPNNYRCRDVKVVGGQMNNTNHDMLIGMDIISRGDFAVSNFRGKTVFTFRIPSQEVTDYSK